MGNGFFLTGSTSIMDSIVQVVPSILNLGVECFNAMTQNELTRLLLGVGFVGIGFWVVSMMISSAKHAR